MSANERITITGRPEVVTLILKTRYPKIKKWMHCIHCGDKLQFTYKQIVMVIEGIAALEAIEAEIQCRRCKALFEIC